MEKPNNSNNFLLLQKSTIFYEDQFETGNKTVRQIASKVNE